MAYLGNDLQVAFPVYRNIDDISGSFNSSLKTFPLTVSGVAPVPAPLYSQQCLISVGGVVQRPDDTGLEGFRLSGGNIIFASAPTTGADFFGVILAGADYINAGGNFPSGTAAVPSITFNDDLDTGIYNSGINQVSITTGGSERLRIDSAGQIESVSLGTAAAPAFSFTTDPNSGIYSPGADQVAISTGGSGRLFVDSSGNVGVGGSPTPYGTLTVFSSGIGGHINSTSGAAGINFYENGSGRFSLRTLNGSAGLSFYDTFNSTERLRITSAGLVGVGTSSPGATLHVNGGSASRTGYFVSTDASAYSPTSYSQYHRLYLQGGSATNAYNGIGFTNGSNSEGFIGFVQNASGYGDFVIQSFAGSYAEKLRVTSAGNVGVGTTNPVVSGLTIESASSTQGIELSTDTGFASGPTIRGYYRSGSSYRVLGITGSQVIFGIQDVEKVRIDSSGRVGIGTSSPLALLDVRGNVYMTGNGTSRQTTAVVNTGGAFESGVESSAGGAVFTGSTAYASIIGSQNSTPLQFGTNGAVRATLDSSGRLGVGTSSPSGLLTLAWNSSAGINAGLIGQVNNSAGANNGYRIGLRTSSDATNWCSIDQAFDNLGGSAGTYIAFTTTSGYTPAERMRLTGTGLGVGTTSPSAPFVVSASSTAGVEVTAGSAAASSGTLIEHYNRATSAYVQVRTLASVHRFDIGTSEALRIDSSGRVGIGTSTVTGYSSNIVHINGATGSEVHLTTGGTGTTAGDGLTLFTRDSDGAAGLFQRENASLLFGTNDQTRVTITSGGSVGIGTTSPGVALDVNGITRASSYFSANDNGYIRGDTAGELRIQPGTNGTVFRNAGNSAEYARIDSSGRLLVGTSDGSGSVGRIVVQGASNGSATGVLQIAYNGSATASLSAGTPLGFLRFTDQGSNGNIFAQIQADVDATTGSNDYPGRLAFSTTADGTNSLLERMRLTSNGYLKVSDTGTYRGPTAIYNELNQSLNNNGLFVRCSNASFASTNLILDTVRAANSAYFFLLGMSGDGADNEFILRGDGNGLCDGSWTGGGADYAEYFEWSDTNLNKEDRRGISVVLDGNKIREAQAGEDPIGVISGNPSVVGDAAWNKWSGKYLRDEFGTYIQEDYEVVNDEGETVVQQRRKLNPAYDPDQEYIPREQRPEWDCVGLMGKLRIRKGQITGSRWIKMRDISDSVEEWLVR